jgi:hypothetical protein
MLDGLQYRVDEGVRRWTWLYEAIEGMEMVAHEQLIMAAEVLGPTFLAAPSCQIIIACSSQKLFRELPQHPNV